MGRGAGWGVEEGGGVAGRASVVVSGFYFNVCEYFLSLAIFSDSGCFLTI